MTSKINVFFGRVIPKKIYNKEVLRRCFAQRAQSAAAPPGGCCSACKTDCQITRSILGGVYPSYCPPRGPAHASDPTFPNSPKIVQKSILIFDRFSELKLTKFEAIWESKSFQNRSKICLIFWSIFGCDFDPKMILKMAPEIIKNHWKINPEPHLVWKTWFSQK